MKCPYCGSEFAGAPAYCPNCRQPLSRAGATRSRAAAADADQDSGFDTKRLQKQLLILMAVVTVFLMLAGIYKVFSWVSDYRLVRLYTRGVYTPTINTLTLEDGRIAHTIAFYGEDGDQIYIPELNDSYSICGGIARVTVADSDWFTGDVTKIESAKIKLTPVLIRENGARTQLPTMNLNIDVPYAPLTITSPNQDRIEIATSRYQLELSVVPGSKVVVNSEELTDLVQRDGKLSQSISVYPIGDNVFTIVVDTPRHRQTRKEIIIYRQKYDINVELDTTVTTVSQSRNTTIRGIAEPGIDLTVETAYIEDSLIVNEQTGAFSFIATLNNLGDNNIRFRISLPGRQDAVITTVVEYRPSASSYTGSAWAMDYMSLRRLYEQWTGRVFLCRGPIVDVFEEGENEYIVVDVTNQEPPDEDESNGPHLVILENHSTIHPKVGETYKAYADVLGRRMYKDRYYPLLAVRYFYVIE